MFRSKGSTANVFIAPAIAPLTGRKTRSNTPTTSRLIRNRPNRWAITAHRQPPTFKIVSSSVWTGLTFPERLDEVSHDQPVGAGTLALSLAPQQAPVSLSVAHRRLVQQGPASPFTNATRSRSQWIGQSAQPKQQQKRPRDLSPTKPVASPTRFAPT